jgi:SAM-dependent methyltransferase
MLAQLRQQLGPQDLPPDLALADATRLPLQPASVPAVLMVHVLHLVSSPDHAVAELRRVLAPGGVFLHDFTRYAGDNPWLVSLRMREEIIAELGVSVRRRPSDGEVHELLRAAGASLRTVVYAEAEERSKPADWLSRTRDRIDSWTWEVPDEAYPEFFTRYERWCREHYGDLEREYAQHVQYELEVWTFDGV